MTPPDLRRRRSHMDLAAAGEPRDRQIDECQRRIFFFTFFVFALTTVVVS